MYVQMQGYHTLNDDSFFRQPRLLLAGFDEGHGNRVVHHALAVALQSMPFLGSMPVAHCPLQSLHLQKGHTLL